MSIRSTEFIEDSARDSKATNELEIRPTGWAFGQIADMETWWNSLPASVRDGKVDVTGYSLGGHLATAFYRLHPDKVERGYTFNGAGVGEVKTGTLSDAVGVFAARRDSGANADLFTDSGVRAEYQFLVQNYSHYSVGVTAASARADGQRFRNMALTAPTGSDAAVQCELLSQALFRIGDVAAEAERMGGLAATNKTKPALIEGASNIAALRLDHQLAVLKAAERTAPHATGLVQGLVNLVIDERREDGPNSQVFFDVYGRNYPSMVANSQIHHGKRVPVFIEDQPLKRGDVIGEAFSASGIQLAGGEVKLLVSGYDRNDFGDTHSIVLLADSLRVMSALARLAPREGANSVGIDFFAELFMAASKEKVDGDLTFGDQGKAEGDTVEALMDSALQLFMVSAAAKTLSDSEREAALKGGSWAQESLRARLEESVRRFTDATQGMVGKLRITESRHAAHALTDRDTFLQKARTDFAFFLSIYTASPFRLEGIDALAQKQLEATLEDKWLAVHQQWLADSKTHDSARSFSDQWLVDRQQMQLALIQANRQNTDTLPSLAQILKGELSIPGVRAEVLEDVKTGRFIWNVPGVGNTVRFGDEKDNTLKPAPNTSANLYGGAGNDQLTGSQSKDHLEGGAGDDKVDAGDGADMLRGGSGSDELKAGGGHDILLGGTGADELHGDAGNDFLSGGTGADKLYGGADSDIVFDEGGAEVNYLWGEAGNDVLEVLGGAGDAYLDGGSGNDVLRGSAQGKSQLQGGSGNDVLTGGDESDALVGDSGAAGPGDGADLIEAGKGDDLITGGGGADLLRGGAGQDHYRFEGAGFGTDVIDDADGQGELVFAGQILKSASFDEDKQCWVASGPNSGGVEIRKLESEGATTLAISLPGDAHSTVYLRNWTPGQLGLTLTGEPKLRDRPTATPVKPQSRAENNFVDFIRSDAAIRQYTGREFQPRFGPIVPDNNMKRASNAVADTFMNDRCYEVRYAA
ncbi:pimeloyl-ACP methyl ester carboxylesterase [Inhella inkyongensis]|uniref:Pimeloyl-ACP methyl ester carboxylesterase n=2 Tax=Inhella inkyongensis TaxID=392593 RepID=A0A840SDD6_9BURK|nr:hypothetical protein [Inhella inkyongensis]MBB5206441.1 pimeloyl-ACP methyl ester carboxylesterase [Inhella inkyongensis]